MKIIKTIFEFEQTFKTLFTNSVPLWHGFKSFLSPKLFSTFKYSTPEFAPMKTNVTSELLHI